MTPTMRVRAVIEVLGTPKEHVERTMGAVVEKLRERKDFTMEAHQVFPAEQVTDKPFFSTFAEVTLAVPSIEGLVAFSFDFMPSSIEILEPATVAFAARHVGNLFNDLLARLHQYDMVLKNVHAENIVLKRKMATVEHHPPAGAGASTSAGA